MKKEIGLWLCLLSVLAIFALCVGCGDGPERKEPHRPEFDSVQITFEDNPSGGGVQYVGPDIKIVRESSEQIVLDKLWDIFSALEPKEDSGGKPISYPRYQITFVNKGEKVFDWTINSEGFGGCMERWTPGTKILNIETYEAVEKLWNEWPDQNGIVSLPGELVDESTFPHDPEEYYLVSCLRVNGTVCHDTEHLCQPIELLYRIDYGDGGEFTCVPIVITDGMEDEYFFVPADVIPGYEGIVESRLTPVDLLADAGDPYAGATLYRQGCTVYLRCGGHIGPLPMDYQMPGTYSEYHLLTAGEVKETPLGDSVQAGVPIVVIREGIRDRYPLAVDYITLIWEDGQWVVNGSALL